LLGNFYNSNKGYAKVVYAFGNKVILQLDGYVEALSFPQPFYNNPGAPPRAVNGADGNPTGDFTNIRVGGILFGEYRFTSAFAINATVDYAQMISDVALDAGGAPLAGAPANTPSALFDLSWRRVQALLGVRYFF
jgi:hypothetical protein